MRKKYLSALLFGALLVTSAGTFTSCKDYDDEINNLQEQITSNKDAIAALQKLVGEGKWVSSISPIENGFTVTMSDGTTQTVTGLGGEDGKPGSVVTIDKETGNWFIDGEDTGVPAKGEDGLTAPSPYIDPTTKNWVVWEFDATTGEFVKKETEVSAVGSNAYVVKVNGIYELHIVDDKGEAQIISLPSTSDSYTVDAPYSKVVINVETATWNPTTTSADYNKLLKAFPEIGKIEKKTLLKQGAELPVLVTPANVDLTEGFKFSLQTLNDGAVENIALSNPTKGLSEGWKIENGSMTRSAETEDCYWTIAVEQELVENEYAETTDAALVTENPNGKVVKTPFAYTISNSELDEHDVTINGVNSGTETAAAEFSSEIDLLAKAKDAVNAPVYFANEFEGKYIITLANELQVEKYGLSIVDGHKLAISKPSNETSFNVTLNVVALGLNGSTANVDVTLTVKQTIASVGELTEQNITLSTEKIGGAYAQIVKWKFDELGFTTATQKDNFLKASSKVTFVDEKGNEVKDALVVNGYKTVKGELVVTGDYKDVEYIGFNLPSAKLIPGEYKVVLTSTENGTSNVIFKTETTITVANPKVEDLFSLASAYTTDGKVLQVVGTIPSPNIEYTISEGVVEEIDEVTNLLSFEDLDNTNWLESDGSDTWGIVSWVRNESGYKLVIPIEGQEWSDTEAKKEGTERLYKERNIRGTYTLFGNSKNTIDYDFKLKVMSPVYTEDGSNVTVDETKMTGKFDGKTINTAANIKATYAAGINKGKELKLFEVAQSTKDVTYPSYDWPEYISGTVGGQTIDYIVDSNSLPIEIDLEDMKAFGFGADAILQAQSGDAKFYLIKTTVTGDTPYKNVKTFNEMFNSSIISKYYKVVNDKTDPKIGGYKRNDTKVAEEDKALFALFEKYSEKAVYKYNAVVSETVEGTSKSAEVDNVTFEFVSPNDAAKYCSITKNTGEIITNTTINDSDLVNGKATVKVKMNVIDKWGMEMSKTFNVTISK